MGEKFILYVLMAQGECDSVSMWHPLNAATSGWTLPRNPNPSSTIRRWGSRQFATADLLYGSFRIPGSATKNSGSSRVRIETISVSCWFTNRACGTPSTAVQSRDTSHTFLVWSFDFLNRSPTWMGGGFRPNNAMIAQPHARNYTAVSRTAWRCPKNFRSSDSMCFATTS